MKKRIFISYYFGDATFKGEVEKWCKEAHAEVVSVNKKDLTPEDREIAKKRIKEQIIQSNLVFILVGNDTHNRPFVEYEVAVAKSQQIPTYWIRLPNRSGAAPEEVRSISPVEFSKPVVTELIRKIN